MWRAGQSLGHPRGLIRLAVLGLFLPFLLFSVDLPERDSATSLQQLLDGNKRYVNNELQDFQMRRNELVSSQSPLAVVVGCSDSRVPLETVFDQNLGDIFVVRVAGNVIGPVELESIQHGVEQLGCPLVFILGHQGCGAVQAVLDGKTAGIANIRSLMQKAVDQSKNLPGDPLENAIISNVKFNMNKLEKNNLFKSFIENKKLRIYGGYYELKSGSVKLISSD